ncbi:MAG: GGDEF domain-containing protein [Myxococcota bacterium]
MSTARARTYSRQRPAVAQGEVPTPPAGVALVIKAANDPSVALPDLARMIEREPSLTVTLLRLANSAAYSTGRPVKTVAQATMLLGTRAIRNLAVASAVVGMKARTHTGGLDARQFWEDSLRRACAALVLAKMAGYEEPAEAFTVGLIQDLGVLVMAAMQPELGEKLQALRGIPGDDRLRGEAQVTSRNHVEHFVALARQWGLPSDLVEAVAHHHGDCSTLADRRLQRLAQLARAADAVADITQTRAAGGSVVKARAVLAQLGSRQALSLDDIVDQVGAEMAAQSKDLEFHIEAQPSFEVLMESANQALVNISTSYEELTRKLEQLLQEKEELAKKLAASNAALRRLATTDPMTGVGNRRAFAEAAELTLADMEKDGAPMCVVTLDVDRFKAVNDKYGHAIGDDVLVAVAERVSRYVRAGDFVGRLGGEEFGVILPRCGEADGIAVAERLRKALRTVPIRCRDGTTLLITASFGGVTLTTPVSLDEALRVADVAMYASKEGGRDRVTWGELVPIARSA